MNGTEMVALGEGCQIKTPRMEITAFKTRKIGCDVPVTCIRLDTEAILKGWTLKSMEIPNVDVPNVIAEDLGEVFKEMGMKLSEVKGLRKAVKFCFSHLHANCESFNRLSRRGAPSTNILISMLCLT